MAQDFRRTLFAATGTGAVTLRTATDFDAIIGIRCCNSVATTIEIDVFIEFGGGTFNIAKGVVIPPNSAVELIQGGAKINLKNGDVLKAKSNTASSLDVVTSFIEGISS